MSATLLRRLAVIILAALLRAAAHAEDGNAARFQPRIFVSPHGGSLPYALYIPRNLDPARKYPVVLYLHDASERGTDNRRQLKAIQDWASDAVQARYPAFIVAPQCPEWKEILQLYGRNRNLAVTTYRDYAGSEKTWKHYKIAVGRQYTGRMNWLCFCNDDWGKDTPVESLFRNIKVYEAGEFAHARTIDFRKAELSPYSGGGRGNNPSVEDAGATLHVLGDTRKKIAFPYTVTKNTTIELDFKSSAQGNVHGIGMDDDDQIQEYRWVQVEHGAASHVQPKEPSVPLRMVMELLPALEKEFPAIDVRRRYVTGISMGGLGVWDLLARRPDWFAAAVPISGGADVQTAGVVAPIPIWAFHGAQDGTVRPDRSRNMIAALWNLGAEPRYTEYPDEGREVWSRAYSESELLPWLFSQRRSTSRPTAPANLRAVCNEASSVSLSWDPPQSGAKEIKEYRIMRDGGEIGITKETRFTDGEIAEGDVHSYTIIAVNHAWIKSQPSAEAWAKVPPDRFPLRVAAVEAYGSPHRVEVRFNKQIDPKSVPAADTFRIDQGVATNDALLLPDQKTVRLNTSALTPKTEYTIEIKGIVDLAAHPNTIPTGTKARFIFDPCLAAHWRLDEGTGAYGADATGNGSGSNGNVVTFNSVDWAPGKWGKALNFDGVSSHYAWTLQSRSLDLTEGLTVALWIKKTDGRFGPQTIITKSNYFDHRTQFTLDFDASHRVRAIVGTLDRGEIAVTGKRIDAREWHHIAMTYGNGKLTLFIDGEPQGEAVGGDKLMSVSEAIAIGAGHQGRNPMCGLLDEVRIYNRALAAAEIKGLATAMSE